MSMRGVVLEDIGEAARSRPVSITCFANCPPLLRPEDQQRGKLSAALASLALKRGWAAPGGPWQSARG